VVVKSVVVRCGLGELGIASIRSLICVGERLDKLSKLGLTP
jgi:hypothetical protein